MKLKQAKNLFSKIKNKWGVCSVGYPIALKGKGIIKNELFYPCHWMPDLKGGFKRPTFEQFLKLYDIKISKKESEESNVK
jgi:hypothetical protein